MSFPENKYHEHTWIKDNPKIGDGTWIGPFCIIDGTGGLTIGKECDISAGTHIYTHSTVIRCVSGKKFEKPWAVGQGKRNKVASLILSPEDGLTKHNYELEKVYTKVTNEIIDYEEYMLDDADYMLVAYGTSARICKQAIGILREKGIKVGYFRPITLWSFPYKELKKASEGKKKVLTVEMSLGQMVEDVKLAVNGSVDVDFYGVPGGMLPTPEAIVEKVVSYE